MKSIFFILFFMNLLWGETTLKIASYNVENLFDLTKNGNEYKEYIPYTKSNWNEKTYKVKLQNITRVLKDIDADIVALEEIESQTALKDLLFYLKQNGLYYKYSKIADRKNTTVKVALISKIPFIYAKELPVTSTLKFRNILEAKFKIDNQELYLFVNHWKAKSGPESMRIISAKKLLNRIKEIGFEKNIILLGDFNSDYEEYKKFTRNRKLNDTNGKTAINHVLNTTYQTQNASKTHVIKNAFYNTWYDADEKNRFTYKYKNRKEALDNILISQSLLQKSGISYINGSVHPFQKNYLMKHKYIYRWQTSRKKPHTHKGKGFSDHLAVVAKFRIN